MKVYKNTVSDLLWEILSDLMELEVLKPFRLVGGTSLSLLLGHRISVDIDLFTDAAYGSIDFDKIDSELIRSFPYVDIGFGGNNSIGKSYYIGKNKDEIIKVDLFYTDKFIRPIISYQNIRLSQLEEIIAMKLEVVGHIRRKKDIWDIHELLEHYSIKQMLDFYKERYPYSYSKAEILNKIIDFEEADTDFDPICLKQKYWELIKMDIEDAVR